MKDSQVELQEYDFAVSIKDKSTMKIKEYLSAFLFPNIQVIGFAYFYQINIIGVNSKEY